MTESATWATRILPKTTLAAIGPSPICTMRSSRHSKATGEPATRGGLTFSEAIGLMPNLENSLSPYESLANQKWAEEVKRLLETLTPIESRIIQWRFGLNNEDELTLKEIGDKYNLSRERIRQLQEQAIGKIRRQMRDF